MNHTAETLPDNTALLKEIILKQAQRIASLEEFIRLEKQQRYGASSEKSADQGELFNEAEAIVEECAAQEDVAVETEVDDNTVAPKSKPIRKPLPARLPRIRPRCMNFRSKRVIAPVVARLPRLAKSSVRSLPHEVLWAQLEVIPAQLRVIQHVRKGV